jgi:hypothetical protein
VARGADLDRFDAFECRCQPLRAERVAADDADGVGEAGLGAGDRGDGPAVAQQLPDDFASYDASGSGHEDHDGFFLCVRDKPIRW